MAPIYTYTYGCKGFLLLLLDPNLQLIQPEEQATLLQGTPITEEGQFPLDSNWRHQRNGQILPRPRG